MEDIHTCHNGCERPTCVASRLAAAEEREKLVAWMVQRSYSTGHGDTMEDLLQELDWQLAQKHNNAVYGGAKVERVVLANMVESMGAQGFGTLAIAAAIRERTKRETKALKSA